MNQIGNSFGRYYFRVKNAAEEKQHFFPVNKLNLVNQEDSDFSKSKRVLGNDDLFTAYISYITKYYFKFFKLKTKKYTNEIH